jgi:hypothetical protein
MGCTMFIWDYIITFRMEVDLVWKSKWNFMKGLYLFQRYLTFVVPIWVIIYRQSDVFLSSYAHFFCRSNGDYYGRRVSEGIIR